MTDIRSILFDAMSQVCCHSCARRKEGPLPAMGGRRAILAMLDSVLLAVLIKSFTMIIDRRSPGLVGDDSTLCERGSAPASPSCLSCVSMEKRMGKARSPRNITS